MIKILFIILLLIFPFGEIARFQIADGVAITLNDLFVFVLGVSWVFVQIIKIRRREKVELNFLKPFLIFCFICIISLLINIRYLNSFQFAVAFSYLARFILYFGLYFVVSNFGYSFKKKIPLLMMISGLTIVIGGYIQYFFYPNLRNLYYLGWDDHLYRMFSSFLDPNFAGIFFVLLFILLFGFFFKLIKEKNAAKICLITVPLLMTFSAVFLTYSRTALISLFFSVLTFLYFKKRKRLIFILLGIFVFVLIIFSKNSYIENLNLFRTASSVARIDSSLVALKIIKENPIFGIGFNAYRYAQIRYGFRTEIGASKSHADAGTDNSFLFIFATTGILGFISYLFFWKTIVKKILMNLGTVKGNDKLISIVFISSAFGIFISSFFINGLFYPFILEWLWILLGLSSIKITENN